VLVDTLDHEIRLLGVNGAASASPTGSPLLVFRWINSDFISDITANGNDYVMSWRHGIGSNVFPGANSWWVSTARGSSGVLTSRRFSEAALPDQLTPPAVASNSIGDTVTVVSEVATAPIARVRAYLEREMTSGISPPLPPTNVSAVGTLGNYRVQWTGFGGENGFIVQSGDTILAIVPAGTRSVQLDNPVSVLWVRGFNAAGLSDPSASVRITGPPRRRAVGHH
jgi:hypothetical protein